MQITPMTISGAWLVRPDLHPDDRGTFYEAYRADALAERVGHALEVAQVNTSVSAAGVVRGVHFSDVPPGQAKYVTCTAGAVHDVVVDLRVGSPTFGAWQGVVLDDVERRAVYLAEGLGHGFCALSDGATVTYLCSTPYAPGREHGVDPFDPALGIAWPEVGRDGSPLAHRVSDKDAAAPGLAAARAAGLLPVVPAEGAGGAIDLDAARAPGSAGPRSAGASADRAR